MGGKSQNGQGKTERRSGVKERAWPWKAALQELKVFSLDLVSESFHTAALWGALFWVRPNVHDQEHSFLVALVGALWD